MDTIMKSDVFFFISSIGFIILWILGIILLIYIIRITRVFHKILKKAEKDIDKIGDITKEMLEDIEDSTIFRLLFGKKKRRRKEK